MTLSRLLPWWAILGATFLGTSATPLPAQVLGNAQLREKLDDLELRGRWYYDDLEGARQEARRTGKPLFVLLRCPP